MRGQESPLMNKKGLRLFLYSLRMRKQPRPLWRVCSLYPGICPIHSHMKVIYHRQKYRTPYSLEEQTAYKPKNEKITKSLKVWWRLPHFLFIFVFFYTCIPNHIHTITIHSSISIRRGLSPFPHCTCAQWGKTSLWCRAENRTRACLPASRRATNWATPHHKILSFTFV